jgi:HEAT repeat protein
MHRLLRCAALLSLAITVAASTADEPCPVPPTIDLRPSPYLPDCGQSPSPGSPLLRPLGPAREKPPDGDSATNSDHVIVPNDKGPPGKVDVLRVFPSLSVAIGERPCDPLRAHSAGLVSPVTASSQDMLRSTAISALSGKDRPTWARVAAAEQLRKAKTVDDLPLFRDLMRDSDARIRCTAIHSVAVIEYCIKKSKLCPRELVAALFDPDPEARDLALVYVGCSAELPMECLPTLLILARSDDSVVRWSIAADLSKFGWASAMAVPQLRDMSKDADFWVRHNAAHSLWRVTRDAKLVVPVLMRNFTEPDVESLEEGTVRLKATFYVLRGVARQSPNEVAPALLDLLQDPSSGIRQRSAALLGAMAEDSPQAKKYLRGLPTEAKLRKLLDDRDAAVRMSAAYAIARIAE